MAGTLSALLGGKDVPRRRYQAPTVQRRRCKQRDYWFIRYRVDVLGSDGERSRVQKNHFLGYCPTSKDARVREQRGEVTKREAESLRNEIMATINRSAYVLQSQVEFAALVGVYEREHLPTLGAATQAKYKSFLRNHILPVFGELRLMDVSTERIQSFLNEKAKDGCGWELRNGLRGLLSGIFSKAHDWGYWEDRNPTERVSVGRKRAAREQRVLTDDEMRALLPALDADSRLIVETAYATGCRISEILGLQWKHVDCDRGWIVIRQTWNRAAAAIDEVKSSAGARSLPLGHIAGRYKERRPPGRVGDVFVFDRGDGRPHDDRALLADRIRPIAKKLKLYWPGFGFHSFRRTSITGAQQVGLSAIEAQKHAGHSRPSMTGAYTSLDPARHERAVRELQERLFGEGKDEQVH